MKAHIPREQTIKHLSILFASTALLLTAATSSKGGAVLKLYYDPIPGNAVSDLTNAAIFPNAPTALANEVLITGLQQGVNFGENYGAWTRGFIEAPQTGQYIFGIASDDDGELWLSTSHDPAGRVKIAENVGFVGQHNYTAKPAQRSALISLVRGQKYYFEMLHKEGVGGDHCSVAWTLPDGSFARPIPGSYLWPFPVDSGNPAFPPMTKAPAILTDYLGFPVTTLPSSVSVEEGRPVELSVTIEASQPAYVQWSSNGVPIPNATLSTYQIAAASLTHNGAVYSVSVTNSLGGPSTASTTLSVTQDTTPPTLVDALNLGNPGGIISVVFSEAVDPVTGTNASNYTLDNGATISGARLGSTPETVLLRATGLTVGPSYTLTVNNVRDLAASPNPIAPGSTVAVEQLLHTWLRLDESTSTTSSDSSGNNRHGSLTNGAAPGHLGQILRSVKFDGVDDHVRLPSGYDDFTAGMTVALWAKPTTAGLWARFIDFANTAASDNILFARDATSDSVTFEVYVGATTGGKVTATSAIVSNQWQHYVATMDASGSTIIYRNGIPLVTNLTGIPNIVTRTNNFLGRSNWGGDGYYGGHMDDVRIYNRVLSAAAVKALAAGAGADDVDPVLPTVIVAVTVPNTALQTAPPGVFTVTRTGSTAAPLTVSYSLGGTATNGVNYTNLTGSVVIAGGSATAQVFVQPVNFSFTDLQRTVVLDVSSSVNYNIADPASGTVTIANNNVAPTPRLATVGNPSALNTVDVWFASSVTTPSATTFGNFVFNPPLTITNATLGNRSLRVVLQVAESVPPNTLLTVTGVRDAGGNSVSNQLPVHRLLSNPVNLVASAYNSPVGRAACFPIATNGIVDNVNNGGGFDTFNTTGTDFVGLLYGTSLNLLAVKVDLGNQFGDGGSWISQPKLYRLRSPVDTNTDRPEQATNYWEELPAPLISGSLFNSAVDLTPSPNTPIVFDLSGLPAGQRAAYGWAVGGATGDGSQTFVSITELGGFGTQGPDLALRSGSPLTNISVVAGQRAKLVVAGESTLPFTYQWQRGGVDIPGETKNYYGLPPVSPADHNAVFSVNLSNSLGTLNSQSTLTVLPRVTPAVVRDATLDPSNSVIYVWFDESVETSTAQNLANYTLNDPGLSLGSTAQDAYGFRVTLTYSGTPSPGTNLALRVSSVQDLSGNIMTSQEVPVIGLASPPTRVIANQYQQGRAAAFTRSTDGVIVNDANVTTWTTFGGAVTSTDFVGVGYDEPQVFSAVVMDLGWQFGDGGDWSAQPRVFIQKTPVDTNQTPPENDTNNWVEVPAVLMSANIFDGTIAVPTGTVPLPNSTIAFDLSQLPLSQRTGFGWAIGGVPGNAIPGNARFVTVAELRGFGVAADTLTNGAPQFALDLFPVSITKLAGARLTFQAAVTGAQPLQYQWRRNGVNLTESGRIIGVNSGILSIVELFGSDAGNYQLIVTNSAGSNASAVVALTVTTGVPGFNGGTNWTRSGGASMAGNTLQLTTGFNQAMSAFLNDPFYIGAFRASFTYQDVGGGGADGTTFVLQNSPAGPAALGGLGGQLGYATAITPSVALVLNIYSAAPGGPGFSLGANGNLNTPYLSTAPVNLAGGNPIAVALQYDGTTVSLTMTDTVTTATFSASAPVDIPAVVGADTAYVGFTAGSGGLASNQRVTDFVFASLPALTLERVGNTFVFTWPVAVGNFLLQESASLTAPAWANVPATVDIVSGQNQVIVSPQAGNRFFRLSLQ